jgi:DNA-directed RNA polymerase subunit RPC12/RpoP
MSDAMPRPVPRCPHCASTRVEMLSLFGSQAVTAQYRCAACGDCFEALKYHDESGASHEPRAGERQ